MNRLIKLIILVSALSSSLTFASVSVVVNGSTHTIPQTNEKGWGTNVTAWIQAISQYTLQNSGGTFTLTAEANTGATYGFKVPYIKTATANPSSAGVLRLAKTDAVSWRNNANSADLSLSLDASNNLLFNSSKVLLSGALVDADISAGAAIALSKLAAVTANSALVSNGSGVMSASATTATEIGYLSGVTSAIQTQLAAKAPTASPTFTGVVKIPDGTVSLPSLTFTNETSSGLSRIAAGDIGLSILGVQALDFQKSSGGFGNVGMGGGASTSDTYPLLVARTNASGGTIVGTSNPSLSSNSKACFQAVANNGAGLAELCAYTASGTVEAITNSMLVRASGTTGFLALGGGDAASGYVRIYTGGDYASTGRTVTFNSDHSSTFNGPLLLSGSSSGVITVQGQAAAGTYNFNLPTTVGAAGTVLTSQGGGATAMTWTAPLTNPMTTGGDLIYGGAAGATTRLANGSAGQFLASTGGTTAPAWTSFATNDFYSGFMTGATWSTTSGTFADPTVVGTNALTQRQASGMTVTAAASSLPGITFTPASATAVYKITASFQGYNTTTGANSAWQLYDGTTAIATTGIQSYSGTQGTVWVVIDSIFAPGTASAVTLKIQGSASAGTNNWGFAAVGSKAAEWTITRIK